MTGECQFCGFCSRPVTGARKSEMKLCPACGGSGAGAHTQCWTCDGHGAVRLSVKRRGHQAPPKADLARLVKDLPD